MGAKPRISSKEMDALPPGRLWWISRCQLMPNIVITFSDDKTPTWIFAKQFADIMWRSSVEEEYRASLRLTPWNQCLTPQSKRRYRMLFSSTELEKKTQQVLRLVTTDLWLTDT